MRAGSQEHDEQVVQLISSCQRRLFLYLLSLLCSRDLAEETLQETNLILWRKRDRYAVGTNFFAWACQIAFYEACKARQQRQHKVPAFSEVFLNQVAPEIQAIAEAPGALQAALLECVDELAELDRQLIEQRYADGATTRSVAQTLGRSTDAIYKSLGRVHQRLFDCVTTKLNQDDTQ
jgi:RNA polymerase sigma-70 factor, ECF subfamily